MFAGAAFTDQADIHADNADAVELLTALGVINGYEDGSFDPEGVVTRAEMAKMIYTIRNGGNDDASAYETVTTSFTDINGHWAEGYIKYLQNTGIVAGKSATRFDPNSQVTTGEAMKMALALAGYDEVNAGLTGVNWLNNTVALATTYGLTDDVHSSIAGGCTRQDAAQILSNCLTEVYAVRWSTVVEGFVNDSEQGLAFTGEPITVGTKWMDLAVETGFITNAPSSKNNPKGIKLAIDSNGNGSYGTDAGENIIFRDATQDVSDLFGYEVKVVWNSDKEDDADAIYGIYKTDNNTDYTMTWDDVEQDKTKTNAVKFDNASYDLDSNFVYFADDVAISGGRLDPVSTNSTFFDGASKADEVVLIDNNSDGKLDAAQIHEVSVAKINYVSNTSMTTALVGSTRDYAPSYTNSPKLADVNTYEGIAKDDYAKVTYDYYNDKLTYEKLDVQTGTIEATRTTGASSTKEVRIDGTWYKAAAEYPLPTTLYTGDSIEFVAIGNLLYHVEKIDGTFGSNSLAIIYKAADYNVGVDDNKVQVSILKRDGSTANVFIDKDNGWNGGAVANAAAMTSNLYKIVTYRVVDGEYRFQQISGTNLAGFEEYLGTGSMTTAYDESEEKFNGKDISDNAIVFVYESDDASTTPEVMSGKSFKAVATADSDEADANYLFNDNNGFDEVMVMCVGFDSGIPTVVGSNFGVLTADAYETVDEDGYRYFQMYVSGLGNVAAREKNGDNYTYDAGTVLTYEIVSGADENGIITIKDVEDASAAYTLKLGMITSDGIFDEKYIGLDNSKYEVDSDTIYVDMNTETNTGVAYGDQAKAALAQADIANGICNVRYIIENGKVKFILTDSTNFEIMGSVSVPGGTTDADVVTDAFDRANTVVVKGALTPDANITVDKGKTLIVEGALTLGSYTLDVDGKLTADSIADLSNVAAHLTGDGTVIIGNQDEVTVAQYKNSVAAQLQLATDIGLTTGTSTAPTPVSASITTTAGAGNYNLVTLTDATYATANATVTAKMVTGGTATTVEKVEVSGANVVLTTTSAHNANGLNSQTVNVEVTLSAPGIANVIAYYQYTITDV